MVTIAGIAVENSVYHFDKIFDYIVPCELVPSAVAGCRVIVPFGRGNKKKQGIIMYVKIADEKGDLKEIVSILDKSPVLNSSLIKLVSFIKSRCYCTYYDAVKTMLPVGINYRMTALYSLNISDETELLDLSDEERRLCEYLHRKRKGIKEKDLYKDMGYDESCKIPGLLVSKGIVQKEYDAVRKVQDASVKMVRLTGKNISKLTPKQSEVREIINMACQVSVKEICYFTGCTPAVVDALVKKGEAEYFEEEIFRIPVSNADKREKKDIILTDEQQNAYENLLEKYKSNKANVSLLYGITGSGKTSVFMKLIDKVYEDGKGIIVMVPEISLTPQMINLFRSRYGDDVAVFHSALSLGERLDQWKMVKNGLAKIAIGTRSAVFAPFDNLGLVIMDEEQEYTYKSESTPRYHARDVAKFRCNSSNCMLLLSSATPSVESFYNAEIGRYSICRLTSRYGSAKLPEVLVADMNLEQEQGNVTGISSVMLEALEENLENHRQSILLLNRRGYNTFVSCRHCKEVVVCPNCSISLTYHSVNNRMMCHYCGYSQKYTDECPSCHNHGLRFSGAGTQRAEQTVSDLLPNARILRLDTDSTMAKYSHEKKLQAFSKGNYDIMIGTQMVAKGLDFPNVTLVGVLSADQMLYTDDYRSYERAFSLLTQVVGRCGRGDFPGRAIIQTYTPENPTILLASKQDYDAFYKGEISMRRAMLYPPFSDICMIGFVGSNQKKTESCASLFSSLLINKAKIEYKDIPLRVLGFSPAVISKLNNKFRYKTVLKFRNSLRFREMMSTLLTEAGKDKRFADVTIYLDINPDSIL